MCKEFFFFFFSTLAKEPRNEVNLCGDQWLKCCCYSNRDLEIVIL